MRKPAFGICENKDADQYDQRLCFRYTDSTIPLLTKFQASSHLVRLYSLIKVGPGRETPKTVFFTRLVWFYLFHAEFHKQHEKQKLTLLRQLL